MKLSENGVEFIANEEGEVLHVYKDQVGLLTAGIGHRVYDMAEGTPITKEQSRAWFAGDVALAEKAVNANVKVALTQNQFDALVDFSFNLGPNALPASTLLKKLNAGDYQGAAQEFPKWCHAGGKVLPVLVARRAREQALFLKP